MAQKWYWWIEISIKDVVKTNLWNRRSKNPSWYSRVICYDYHQLFFEIICQSWECMYCFGLEMILMDKNSKWRYISGRSSEDNPLIKKVKQSIMILKSYMLRLPSTLFLKNMVNHEIMYMFLAQNYQVKKYIWKM